MKTTVQLIQELRSMPMGNMYLEKGILQKEICQRLGLDFYTVRTEDFDRECKTEELLTPPRVGETREVRRVTESSWIERVTGDIQPLDVIMKGIEERAKPKIGDLFVYSWGATMRRNEFYQVVKVQGCKVWLTCPLSQTEAHGYDAGNEWIHAVNTDLSVQAYAKIVKGKLKKCSDEQFKVDRCSWDTLVPTEIGKKHSFYGD